MDIEKSFKELDDAFRKFDLEVKKMHETIDKKRVRQELKKCKSLSVKEGDKLWKELRL